MKTANEVSKTVTNDLAEMSDAVERLVGRVVHAVPVGQHRRVRAFITRADPGTSAHAPYVHGLLLSIARPGDFRGQATFEAERCVVERAADIKVRRGACPAAAGLGGAGLGHHWFVASDAKPYLVGGGPGPSLEHRRDGGGGDDGGCAYDLMNLHGTVVDDTCHTYDDIRSWAAAQRWTGTLEATTGRQR